jgi:hypothetical protein
MAIPQFIYQHIDHPSYLSAKYYRRSRVRVIRVLPAILLISLVTSSVSFAEVELFSAIEPFAGLRYGMAYDTAAQTAAKGGRSCVDFDPKKTHSMGDGKQDNDSKEYSRSSDIVKQMNLSADAQAKALTGTYRNATLDVANKTEVHKQPNVAIP